MFDPGHSQFSGLRGLSSRIAAAAVIGKHKVFISYHHERDQWYKEELVALGETCDIFVDKSVDTGSISEHLEDEQIRTKIRDNYLQDSTVTIVLIGTETKYRKHVDWEIRSSMHDSRINKRSGILAVYLPTVQENAQSLIVASHDDEQNLVYPEIDGWRKIGSRQELERRHPYMPSRILDNLNGKAKISVTTWDRIQDPAKLKFLIDMAFRDRNSCKYDLSKPMRRRNSQPAEKLFDCLRSRT